MNQIHYEDALKRVIRIINGAKVEGQVKPAEHVLGSSIQVLFRRMDSHMCECALSFTLDITPGGTAPNFTFTPQLSTMVSSCYRPLPMSLALADLIRAVATLGTKIEAEFAGLTITSVKS